MEDAKGMVKTLGYMEKQSPNTHWLLPVDETRKRLIVEILGLSFSSSSPLKARTSLYSSHRSSPGSRLQLQHWKALLDCIGKCGDHKFIRG